MRKFEDDIKRCNTVACIATRQHTPGQGGGERESVVAKQGIRLGQGGDKRGDNADKRDRPGQGLGKARTRTRQGH